MYERSGTWVSNIITVHAVNTNESINLLNIKILQQTTCTVLLRE